MKVSMIFGAGISQPFGVASTQDITDRIFSGKDVIRHTDSSYYILPDFPTEPVELYRDKIDVNIQFLNILKEKSVHYYEQYTNRKWNYEDLYYLVEELYQEVSGDTDNPITKYFLDKIDVDLYRFVKHRDNEAHHINDLHNFFGEVKNYIKCIVSSMLDFSKSDGLALLRDIQSEKKIEQLNIFTLNHDVLLENILQSHQLNFCDGFSGQINNVRYWSPNLYFANNKINLFKVHGSINWYRLRKDGSDWHDEEIGIPVDGNVHRSKNREGKYQFDCDTYPQILVGTFNKLSEYSSGIFLELLCLFNKFLNESDNLIISGYSFGDKGINARITDWAYKSRNKRIIVINPNLKSLVNNARGSIRHKWNKWLETEKLKTIETGIENISWDDIKKNLLP